MPGLDDSSGRRADRGLLGLDLRALRLYAEAPEAVRRLLDRLSAHHPYSARHSLRVAVLAGEVAARASLDRRDVERSAMLHDVGKLFVPSELLDAPRRLRAEEMDLVRRHARLGATLLAEAGLAEHSPAARHHHERFDGGGYPDGLSDDQIPLVARLLALCDAAEAMLAPERRFKEPRSPAQVLEAIAHAAGTQFDPHLMPAFAASYRQLLLASPRPALSLLAQEANPSLESDSPGVDL